MQQTRKLLLQNSQSCFFTFYREIRQIVKHFKIYSINFKNIAS